MIRFNAENEKKKGSLKNPAACLSWRAVRDLNPGPLVPEPILKGKAE